MAQLRPHRSKTTLHSRADSAAATFIRARLWWLCGLPIGNVWKAVPYRSGLTRSDLAIDENLIRRGAYALRKLRGEFQAAIARVVDDHESWFAGADAILSALKLVVHRGEKPAANLLGRGLFTRSLETELAAASGQLRIVADTLSWAYATQPGKLSKIWRWFSSRECAGQSDPATIISIAHLVAKYGKKAEPIAELAFDPDRIATPLRGFKVVGQLAARIHKGTVVKPWRRVKPQLPSRLPLLISRLVSMEPKRGRRLLALLAACRIPELLRIRASWWKQSNDALNLALNIGKSHDPLKVRLPRLVGPARALKKLAEARPNVVEIDTLFESLDRISESAALTKNVRRLLEIANRPSEACAIVFHFGNLFSPQEKRRTNRLPGVALAINGLWRIDAFAKHRDQWLKTLREQLNKGHQWTSLPENDLLDESFPGKRIPEFYASVARIAPRVSVDALQSVMHSLMSMFEHVRNSARSEAYVLALYSADLQGRWLSSELVRGIELVCDETVTGGQIAALVRLDGASKQAGLATLLGSLLPVVGGSTAMLQALLAGKDLSPLVTVASRLALLKQLKAPMRFRSSSQPSSCATWIESYPLALHESLSAVDCVLEDAEAVTRSVLRRLVPTTAAISMQLDRLRQELDSSKDARERAHMETRIATLEQRLAEPAELKASTIEKARTKILRAAARRAIDEAGRQSQERLEAKLHVLLGLSDRDTEPADDRQWLTAPRTLRVLTSALKVVDIRELALQILRVRCGPRPWDFREHPANRKFVRARIKAGLNMTPWIDGIGQQSAGSEHAPTILELDDDPLEIFAMGEHFGTCLSVDQFNFFSVFANAADINKRVLYARDRKGTVVGRRLICLSNDGALVAFRAYAHDQNAEFARASDRFVIELARQMSASVAPGGTIANLVSTRWYDDGPIDVAGVFEFLSDGSVFRKKLTGMAPDQLSVALDEQTGTKTVNSLLAPMLAQLPEFKARPELLIALVHLIGQPNELPLFAIMHLVGALERSGNLDLAASRFVEPLERAILSGSYQWGPDKVWSFLARARPSRTLRLLRRTRSEGVRTHQDDVPRRTLAAARCLLELKRPKQAAELLKAIIEHPKSPLHGPDFVPAQRLLEQIHLQHP